MMKGQYDVALKCLLSIGALHSARSLPQFESQAVNFSDESGSRDLDKPWQAASGLPFTYVLGVIDNHHLHQCLLDGQFLSALKAEKALPLFSLLQLVGFQAMGTFLIEHCVPPQSGDSSSQGSERRGTLPLDLVAKQLEKSPQILHWYLHLVFVRKPEIYVKFPNTAYPPRAVTDLHRRHFDLYVKYAGKERNSAEVLSGVEAYKVGGVSTALLSFLKVSSNKSCNMLQDGRWKPHRANFIFSLPCLLVGSDHRMPGRS